MKLTGDRCQCKACGEYFNRTSTFDLHRYGPMIDRKCLTRAEMFGKGWLQNDGGFWIRSEMPAITFAKREGAEIGIAPPPQQGVEASRL